MHSYFTSVAALVALFCSFYKEHLAPVQAPSVKHAFILLQYVAQVAVVLLALWTAIDTGRKAEQIRIAQLDADAAQAASQHTVPILDYYFLKILPNRSEERRVGKECVSTCKTRWWPCHNKKKQH